MPLVNAQDHDRRQLTVAELIEMLSAVPQVAKVWVDGDYSVHHCEGVRIEDGKVYLEIG
jgi:hypothetical protein